MSRWTCAACGAPGSEFDAHCASCGGAMPTLSLDTAEDAGPDPRIGQLVGRHRVIARIGQGGMGVVYEAADEARGGKVALKLLAREVAHSPAARARFAKEAQAAARIESPHVVRILDHGVWEGTPYIAMQLLHGEDLAARLDRVARLPAAETAAIVGQVARALAAARAAGIVHRDLKPENVFLAREDGREVVKILDFGVAKQHATGLLEGRTQTGTLVGTPHYMSPEQAEGTRQVDHRSDLWSLAVIAFRCLTGRLPFESSALGDLLMKIMKHPLPSPSSIAPDLPPALDAWWSRAAARDAAARFATADEMAGALRLALGLDAASGAAASLAATVFAPESGVAPPSSGPLTTSLTEPDSVSERHWVSVALVRLPAPAPPEPWTQMRHAIERHGGRLERLEGGSAVALFALAGSGAGDAATDLAVRAARCALSLHENNPHSRIAVLTGRNSRRGDLRELLGRGEALLSEGEGDSVRVDEATRHLLETRFDITDAGVLGGERDDEAETRTLLRRPVPFVGRARELATLRAIFEESEAAPVAQAAIVVGVAGIGKSRLRQELLADLLRRPRPPAVWIARGEAVSAGSPFGMIARALRREAAILDGEPLHAQRAKLGERFGRRLAGEGRGRTLAFLGELCNVPSPDDASVELRAARQSPMLMGDHIHAAFEELMVAELADGPIVLVLEDLHWGDRPSVDLVDGVLRNLPDAPLFVLALGRPEISASFGEPWSERRVQTLRLGELLPKQGEALVRSVLGDGIDDEALGKIVERAAGNAFFLGELVRSFAEGKRDAMPETVLAMLGARIEHLDPTARRVLRAASLFGQTFWVEGAAAVIGDAVGLAEIDAAITTCVRRELLVRRRTSRLAGQTEIAFRHALVRDAAAAMVADESLAAGHRRVAEWLERAGEHDMVVLAEHYERGGDAARAAEAYRRAASQALEGNDFAAAIERAERAIAAIGPGAEGETLGVLRRIQAEAHGCRDEREQAKARGREAMRLLAPGSAPWCAAVVEANRASTSASDLDHLRSAAEQLLALDPAAPEPHHLACAAMMVSYLHGTDQHAEAARLLERAETLARAPGATTGTAIAWLHHARAWSAFVAGDAAANLRHEELSVAAFERAGDARNACYIRVGLGHSYREVGALAAAERTLREALRTAERLGLPNVVRGARYTLSSVLLLRGALPEARALASAAVQGFLAQGDARTIGYSRIELARILAASGELDAAESEAEAAQGTLGIIPSGRAYALGALAEVRLLRGDPAGALAAAREAAAILAVLGALPEGEILVRLALAEALHASNDPAAPAALAEARASVLDRAARIQDAELRRSFVEGLPHNARALHLARERLP